MTKQSEFMECIFCAIANKKVQSIALYEDDKVMMVLDIYPSVPGQVIIFPKRHIKYIWDLDLEEQIRIISLVSVISKILKELFNPNGISIYVPQDKIAGQNFDHLYVYVIPRYEKDNVKIEWQRNQVDLAILKELAKKIVKKLSMIKIKPFEKEPSFKNPVKEVKEEKKNETKKYIWYIKKP